MLKTRNKSYNIQTHYTTHKIKNGVDLWMTQELFDHTKPETTLIYNRVAPKYLLKARSLLDEAVESITKSVKMTPKFLPIKKCAVYSNSSDVIKGKPLYL